MKEKIVYTSNKSIYNINYGSNKIEYYEIQKNVWDIWDSITLIDKKIEERNKKIDQILL
jgi:hypothetical protein